MDKVRVLVADKQALVREGICALLRGCENIEVVGAATNGKETLEMIGRESPDIVLVDTTLPVIDASSVTRRIRKENKKTKVLFLSENDDKECVIRGIRAGGDGYIIKGATAAELLSAIITIHEGGCFLYPAVAKSLVEEFISARKRHKPEPYDRLTIREKEILNLIAEGHRGEQVARILNISTKTVQHHRTSLMRKLDIHSQGELIKYAIRKHLIEIEM